MARSTSNRGPCEHWQMSEMHACRARFMRHLSSDPAVTWGYGLTRIFHERALKRENLQRPPLFLGNSCFRVGRGGSGKEEGNRQIITRRAASVKVCDSQVGVFPVWQRSLVLLPIELEPIDQSPAADGPACAICHALAVVAPRESRRLLVVSRRPVDDVGRAARERFSVHDLGVDGTKRL